MKAQMTKQEALEVLREANLQWPKSERYFANKISEIIDLPDTAIIVLDSYTLTKINRQPHPYEGATIVRKDGLKGKVVFLGWDYMVKWDDHHWYRQHLTYFCEHNFVLDETRTFWKVDK